MAEKEADAAGDAEKKVILVGFDDSDHSLYALQWTLGHFFAGGAAGAALGHKYKLVIVYPKPIPSIAVGIGGPGAADVLPIVESNLNKIAARAIANAKELCVANSVNDAEYEIGEGDARNVLVDAAERLHAEVLVVGSHGHGAVKRAVLGSVSDYCAHHVHCTLMIVKKPKLRH
ncbi:hypothetical protein KSP39_PZI018042 [Platanthera zijinensis]|uniref:UspA domain-containing protein n=1 Tax=Platanthera zijinensis TaxID=2320716 RepID=A0AAP0B317_9ASPA